MKCLILAAGYGTRMQAVTGDIPKALIRLGDQTILDLLMQRLDPLDIRCTLITNHKYYDQFVRWQRATNVTMTIVSNGTEHVDERLGAIGDICFALEKGQLDDDLLIVAADTLFNFPLQGLVQTFQSDRCGVVAVRHNNDLIDLRRRGVVEADSNGRITGFTEKPDQPASHLAATPLYILPREMLTEPARYLAAGGNPDAPGYLIEYLVAHHSMKAWQIPGEITDVGNPDSYSAALSQFESNA